MKTGKQGDAGRVALVTGAASGIGFRLCERLLARGYSVYGADIGEIALVGPRFTAVALDVRSAESWARVVEAIRDEAGEIDLLANVAGVIRPGWSWDQADDDIDFHIDVNLKGVIRGCHAVIPSMKQRGSGVVVNVASLAGLTPVPGLSLYSASKFGVRGYSLSIAPELAEHGVHVSVVCPDAVKTPMLDQQAGLDEAALTFSGSGALTVEQVVDRILRDAVERRATMVAFPRSRAVLAQLSGAAPAITQRLLPLMRSMGRRGQSRYKDD